MKQQAENFGSSWDKQQNPYNFTNNEQKISVIDAEENSKEKSYLNNFNIGNENSNYDQEKLLEQPSLDLDSIALSGGEATEHEFKPVKNEEDISMILDENNKGEGAYFGEQELSLNKEQMMTNAVNRFRRKTEQRASEVGVAKDFIDAAGLVVAEKIKESSDDESEGKFLEKAREKEIDFNEISGIENFDSETGKFDLKMDNSKSNLDNLIDLFKKLKSQLGVKDDAHVGIMTYQAWEDFKKAVEKDLENLNIIKMQCRFYFDENDKLKIEVDGVSVENTISRSVKTE